MNRAFSELGLVARAERNLRADIQALRALAVLLVLTYHLWPHIVSGGYVGVDVFFVISGFLITGLLAREANEGNLSLRRFWIRRARRLLPSSLGVLALAALATLTWISRRFWDQTFREIIASVGYVQNWLLAANSIDYLASDNKPSIVQHYWTLSMEEQFYIALPLLMLGFLKLRLPARSLPWLLAGIGGASFAYSIHLTAVNAPVAYFATTTRAWEFAIGGLLATAGWQAPARLREPAVWAGLALIVTAGLAFDERTPFPGYLALLPVIGTTLVIWAASFDGVAHRLMRPWPIQLVGDVSYAVYLWHWPLILLAPRLVGTGTVWSRTAIGLGAILLGWLTTRYVEDPIRKRPIRTGTGSSVAVWSLAGGALVVAISAFGLSRLTIEEATVSAGTPCFGAGAMIQHCPEASTIVPDVELVGRDGANRAPCWTNNGETTLRICTVGLTTGYSRHFLAIGDSHNNALRSAYQWMAEQAGWRIDVTGKAGCYLTDAALYRNIPSLLGECADWQAKVWEYLERSGPYDAILVTHQEGYPLVLEGKSQHETEVAGLVAAWTRVNNLGSRVIAIRDVPRMPKDVVACVQDHRLEANRFCAAERAKAFPDSDSQQDAASRVAGARLVDLSDIYCNERCLPVIGGVAVYQSWGHITSTFGKSLAPYLLEEVERALD